MSGASPNLHFSFSFHVEKKGLNLAPERVSQREMIWHFKKLLFYCRQFVVENFFQPCANKLTKIWSQTNTYVSRLTMHFPLYTHFISRQMLLKQGVHVRAHTVLCHNAIPSVVSCQCLGSDSKSLLLCSEQSMQSCNLRGLCLDWRGKSQSILSVGNGRQREGQWMGQLANRFLDKSNFCSVLRNSY